MSVVHVIKRCPVCEMVVRESVFTLKYLGIDYLFCSEQCQSKFERRPHLFVGNPMYGKSEKQKGRKAIKAHRIKLYFLLDEPKEEAVSNEISGLMGVQGVEVNGDEIGVIYDLLQVSLKDIEDAIIRSHGYLKESITQKIRRGIIHYSEECELDNLAHLSKDTGCH
jgi:YHS domain-containing protein/copper chaperone CopZ